MTNSDEIELEEEEQPPVEENPADDEIELPEEEEEEDDGATKTKKQAMMARLRKLKMKMNQARQLNRSEVLREGERLGSEQGVIKERKRQNAQDKKRKEQEWEAHNAKALELAAENGVDGKLLVEQASDSMRKTMAKAEKTETNRYSVKDYHNPEGQHRNYQRNLKSLPARAGDQASTDTYNPLMAATTTNQEDEADGAKRLAIELKRRIEKQAKKRSRPEFEANDVSYINQRNKRFNQKISRNYDQASADIKASLERGTAL